MMELKASFIWDSTTEYLVVTNSSVENEECENEESENVDPQATVEEFIFPGDIQATAQLQRTEKLTIPACCAGKEPQFICNTCVDEFIITIIPTLNQIFAGQQPSSHRHHLYVKGINDRKSLDWQGYSHHVFDTNFHENIVTTLSQLYSPLDYILRVLQFEVSSRIYAAYKRITPIEADYLMKNQLSGLPGIPELVNAAENLMDE